MAEKEGQPARTNPARAERPGPANRKFRGACLFRLNFVAATVDTNRKRKQRFAVHSHNQRNRTHALHHPTRGHHHRRHPASGHGLGHAARFFRLQKTLDRIDIIPTADKLCGFRRYKKLHASAFLTIAAFHLRKKRLHLRF